MANSHVRCNVCRNYFKSEEMYRTGLGGFGGVCSEECFETYLEKYRKKRARRKEHREMKYTSPTRIPGSVRDRVRRRDDDKCQWCGSLQDLQIHHVRYRSEGGPDHQKNLITLCAAHHEMAHSNKKKYQPVLLLWLWYLYVKLGKVTVPQAFRLATRNSEWVDEARTFSNEVYAEFKSEKHEM